MRLFPRLAVLSALLLVGSVAHATPARVVGLGDQGAFVEDDTNVLTYPSAIARYAHFAFIDIGSANGVKPSLSEIQTAGGPTGGAYLHFGDLQVGVLTSDFVASEEATFLTLAAFQRSAATRSGPNSGSLSDLAGMATLRRYDFIFGYGTPKDFSAGLRISFGGSDQSFTPPTSTRIHDASLTDTDMSKNTRDWSVGDRRGITQVRAIAGVSLNLGGGTLMDAAVDYTNYGAYFNKNGLPTFDGGGGNAIGLSARLRFPITRFWTIIPQVSYRGAWFALKERFTIPAFGAAGTEQSVALVLPAKDGAEVIDHGANMHTVDLGAAAELKASKIATFWVSAGVALFSMGTTWSDKDTETANKIDVTNDSSQLVWALPYVKFAAEVSPFEWMHARIGAEKYSLAATSSSTATNRLNDSTVSKVPNTQTSTAGNSIPGSIATQADFNVYVGTSFLLMQGFSLDMLLLNQIFLGNFKSGFAGRAGLSYKF